MIHLLKANGMQIPNHIGVILDGNRRWASTHHVPAWMGHRKGYKTFDKFLDWCAELGVPQVSAYVLSTENLDRPKKEVDEICKLAYDVLKTWDKNHTVLDKYEIKVKFVGDLHRLPPKLVKLMGSIMLRTEKYQKHFFNFLVAYGSKFELTQAVKKIAEKVMKSGIIEINQKDIEQNLLVPMPINLLIRTGGFSRLSNFMLWQAAYSELYVTKTLWPDFSKKELVKAIRWYNSVQKTFGR